MNMSNLNATIGSITYVKLNGDNYLLWANGVYTYLSGQNKHKYLTETAPFSIDANYAKWIQDKAQIRSLIWHSIESPILGTIMHYKSTKGLGDALNLRYGQANNNFHLC